MFVAVVGEWLVLLIIMLSGSCFSDLCVCVWTRYHDKSQQCPHATVPRRERPTKIIADTALDFVGNTPLIRLDRLREALNLPAGIQLLAKAECYSAGTCKHACVLIDFSEVSALGYCSVYLNGNVEAVQ